MSSVVHGVHEFIDQPGILLHCESLCTHATLERLNASNLQLEPVFLEKLKLGKLPERCRQTKAHTNEKTSHCHKFAKAGVILSSVL